MKVLIVASSDIVGGAHKAAYRLHRALLTHNIDSQMLVQNKNSDDYTIIGPTSSLRKYLINPLRPALDHIIMKMNSIKTLFSSSYLPFSEIVRQINKIQPDVVHLHWVTGGMMRIEDIAKIKAPIVWNCQDMWPFTGGCHFSGSCKLYKESCGNCPILESHRTNDLSKKVIARKSKSYAKVPSLTVVGVSKWMAVCAGESSLFSNRKIVNIPNCLDVNLFKPIDKNIVRDLFNIPRNKKVILFGAANPTTDQRKGGKELFESIKLLDLKSVVLVIAGSTRPEKVEDFKYPVYFISPLRDEVSLPMMYNIADVIIVPSLEENLSNSIIESLACGIPVVSFDIGGNSDMIEHKKNGYLSQNISSKDLAKGISWVLEYDNYKKLSSYSREKVLKEFDSKVVAKRYIELYKDVLGGQ